MYFYQRLRANNSSELPTRKMKHKHKIKRAYGSLVPLEIETLQLFSPLYRSQNIAMEADTYVVSALRTAHAPREACTGRPNEI